jgi:hypothetical protein
VSGAPDGCDCPSCSGADLDLEQLVDVLLAAAADLTGSEDPLDAELLGATVMSIGGGDSKTFEEALIGGFIPEVQARATAEALALLLAIGSVAEGRAGKEAFVAAARLVEAGVPRPGWAAELVEPVTVADCVRLSDTQGTASMLACSFHRAGRPRAVVISVDHQDCGAAESIVLLDADNLPEALEMMRETGRDDGLDITTEVLDAAEFRWQVEHALDARAVHDSDVSGAERFGLANDEDGPVYPVMAVLIRARMEALPLPNRPAAPHGDDDAGLVRHAAMRTLAQLKRGPFGAGTRPTTRSRTTVPALPAKRKRSGRAPIYQIKVGLRGATPPIWRRLEVPADISLARLHTVIQIAFGWSDDHLHVFETPYGSFGTAGTDLGYRAETSATLEQVASAVNDKLCYTYDFGDDWDHDIRVEKVLDDNEQAGYPRCTGGRRAAPPEDCGGIWGYAELVRVLSDPADDEHQDRLDWLGLGNAADFDPDRFDAAAVNRVLGRIDLRSRIG